MSETAKTPWREDKASENFTYAGARDRLIYSADGLVIAVVIHDGPPEAIPNAELIVRSCNAHDELVKALDDLLNQVVHWGDDDQLSAIAAEISASEAALSKARGEQS